MGERVLFPRSIYRKFDQSPPQGCIALRPEWAEVIVCEDGVVLSEKERKEIKPMECIKMVMTRGQDDPNVNSSGPIFLVIG